MDESEKPSSLQIKGIEAKRTEGAGFKIGIVHTRWNSKVVTALVDGCKKELLDSNVAEADIVIFEVMSPVTHWVMKKHVSLVWAFRYQALLNCHTLLVV